MTPSSSPSDILPPGAASGLLPRPGLSTRISGLYLAVYLHFGFFGFLPLWLSATGATAGEIGILMAIPLMLRLVTVAPFSAWAGRTGRVRSAIAFTALGSAALITLLLRQPDHLGRVLIVVAFSTTWDQIPVLTDAYAVMAVRRDGLDFGRLRVWGSIGAVASSAGAGWAFGLTGIAALPWLVAALLILPALVTLALPSDRTAADEAGLAAGSWRQVVGDLTLMRLVVAASLVMASHGVLTSFGPIQWAERGISTGVIGMLQAIAVSAEIVAFWFGSKLLGRRDPGMLIWLAGCVSIVRWLVMAGDPSASLLFVVQLLQGVTATGAILGTMLVIASRVPLASSAAAQGLNAVLLGLALAATTAGAGVLWQRGVSTAYLSMAALAAIAVLLAWPGWRLGSRDVPAPDEPPFMQERS
ncbi:MFS transporter [Sphingomonas sp. RIT328]|uniref:MFS transporter n=1 Tax=Sphingomonas sp. RIT328 TaxID=1470591 RepID=UPI000451D654|nr:MFS transporter [Sphingomonas sp. RIT328]EZP50028.1 putative 3-phenylpropionic acid transporter [Sphingomonas sp. RIT328]